MLVTTDCPSTTDLMLAALAKGNGAAPASVANHVRDCAQCRARLAELRDAGESLRTTVFSTASHGSCLDEHDIARVMDGADADADRPALMHVASCEQCRWQLSDALRVVRDPAIAAEVTRLESPARPAIRRGAPFAVAGGLAAAALLAVLIWPYAERQIPPGPMASEETYRERTITTTAAPRIIGPTGQGTADSLVWTSVPGADVYRITFWREDGTTVWEGEARDTIVALPAQVERSGAETVLWQVKARTGWDRWVVSELVQLDPGARGAER